MRTCLCGTILTLLLFRAVVVAQLVPVPTVLTVWGGAPGTTVDTVINGANLNQTSELRLGGGLTAQIVGAAAGAVTAKVTIPPGTAPGLYDLRVITPGGASTPGCMFFHVSSFPNLLEAEPNNSLQQHTHVAELPVTINGLINGNEDRDFFHFVGRRGQRLVCEGFSERLLRPAGATPLNLELALFDESGKRIATGSEREPGHNDPTLECVVPEDGHYLLEARDQFYRGAGVFSYRINLGVQPVLDSATPAVIGRGGTFEVTVRGRNLEGVTGAQLAAAWHPGQILLTSALNAEGLTARVLRTTATEAVIAIETAATATTGARDLRLSGPQGASNALKLLTLDAVSPPLSVPHHDRATAARLILPCAHSSLRSRAGAPSWYVFKGKAGERWIIEVYGRRMMSAMDPALTLYDANGRELQFNDDSIGVDPRLDFNITQAGENDYYLRVHDAAVSAVGVDSSFVLAARAFKPDFLVTANPENPNLVRGGAVTNVQFTPSRLDGFNGPIEILAEGLPPGVSFAPAALTGGQANLAFKAEGNAPLGSFAVRLRGKATINNEAVVREVLALSPYQYGAGVNLTRPLGALVVTVVEPFNFTLATATPQLMVTQGANVQTQLKITRNGNFPGNIQLAYAGLPAGLTITPNATGDNNLTVNLTIAAAATAPPGAHNVTITGTSQVNGKNESRTATLTVMVAAKS